MTMTRRRPQKSVNLNVREFPTGELNISHPMRHRFERALSSTRTKKMKRKIPTSANVVGVRSDDEPSENRKKPLTKKIWISSERPIPSSSAESRHRFVVPPGLYFQNAANYKMR